MIDGLDGGAVEAHPAQAQMDLWVALDVQDQADGSGQPLTDDGGQGGTGHTQGGQTEPAEDQDGVQDEVGDGTGELGHHGQLGPAGGLEEALHGDLDKDTQGGAHADVAVVDAVGDDLCHIGLEPEKGAYQQSAQDGEDHIGADRQENAGVGGSVGGVLVLGAQGAGDQGVDAHTGAAGHGDHQGLEGEGQGDGRQGVLADLGHEDAVHDVVQSLDQHGDHHRDGHAHQEPAHGHDAHLVFRQRGGLGFVFHWVPPVCVMLCM